MVVDSDYPFLRGGEESESGQVGEAAILPGVPVLDSGESLRGGIPVTVNRIVTCWFAQVLPGLPVRVSMAHEGWRPDEVMPPEELILFTP
jgi:hypothetical protein